MKEPSNATVKLERAKINEAISKDQEYRDEDILIKNWEGNNSQGNYLAEIAKEDSQFDGILNNRLEKEGYGFYKFPNGDHYFGSFKYDKRNNNGFYIWPQEEIEGKIHIESYHGFWKDNKKNKLGTYLWLNEEEDNEEFDNANFDVFVGKIEGNNFERGTFLKKNGDNYYVYHGDFASDGKKNDEKGYYYCSSLDRLFHGKIENDSFKNGYISYFDEEGNMTKIIYCEFESNNDLKNILTQEEMNQEELQKEMEENILFRNVILGIDYFGSIYSTFKETYKFLSENVGELSIFEDKDAFPNIMKYASAYNKNNIYIDIETKVFGKKM